MIDSKKYMKKSGFMKRVKRIWGLLIWLFRLAGAFRRLGNVPLLERERVLRQAALDGLAVLNVVVQHQPLTEKQGQKGVLVVSNHVSWLDIMVVCALYPCGFVAKQEIRSWPMIGKIVANAGTVFINRSNRKDIDSINAAIAQKLNEGGSVCFYPEARTTLGNAILPLKAALFESAIQAQAVVQPLALRYYDDGVRTEAVSFADVNLLVSLWKIVSIEQIEVRVDVFEPLVDTENMDRFAIKDKVENLIREAVLRDSPNPERVLSEVVKC